MDRYYYEDILKSKSILINDVALTGLSVYINAGGRGTRLNEIFHPDDNLGVTKALLRFDGTSSTLLEMHIDSYLTGGADTVIAGVGDHLNASRYIEDRYFDSNNVHSVYYEKQLGNGGDLVRAVRDHSGIFSDDIYIANVDTFIDVDRLSVNNFHHERAADLTFILSTRSSVPNHNAFHVGHEGEIIYTEESDRSPRPDDLDEKTAYQASSTGGMIISKEILQNFDWQPDQGALGLYRDIVGSVIASGLAFAYNNEKKEFIDVGTVDNWQRINNDRKRIGL